MGVMYAFSKYPYPENVYTVLLITPSVLVLYFIFHKIFKMSKEIRGFQITDEEIRIQNPSKPFLIVPWKDLIHVQVIINESDIVDSGPTYHVIFWERKKECSNHTRGPSAPPGFMKVIFSE